MQAHTPRQWCTASSSLQHTGHNHRVLLTRHQCGPARLPGCLRPVALQKERARHPQRRGHLHCQQHSGSVQILDITHGRLVQMSCGELTLPCHLQCTVLCGMSCSRLRPCRSTFCSHDAFIVGSIVRQSCTLHAAVWLLVAPSGGDRPVAVGIDTTHADEAADFPFLERLYSRRSRSFRRSMSRISARQMAAARSSGV